MSAVSKLSSNISRLKQIAADKMRGDSKEKYASSIPEHQAVRWV